MLPDIEIISAVWYDVSPICMFNADVATDSITVACSPTLSILELLIPITAITAITAIAIPTGIAIFLLFVIPLIEVFVP